VHETWKGRDYKKRAQSNSDDNNTKAWMPDFDLAGKENTRYPAVHNAVGIEGSPLYT